MKILLVVVIAKPRRFKRADRSYFEELHSDSILPHSIEYVCFYDDDDTVLRQAVDDHINRRLKNLLTGEASASEDDIVMLIAGDDDYINNMKKLKNLGIRVLVAKSIRALKLYNKFATCCTWISLLEEGDTDWTDWDKVAFEKALLRPHLQVSELLEIWHRYLDYIDKVGDLQQVVIMYESCVGETPCSKYPKYWVRYILRVEAMKKRDLANSAITRAFQKTVFANNILDQATAQFYLRPEIHLFAARWKEQNGDINGARAAFQLLHSEICPGLLETVTKHAKMERRQVSFHEPIVIEELVKTIYHHYFLLVSLSYL